MNNYSNEAKSALSEGPTAPEMMGNIPELINRLFAMSADQREVLTDCRRFEDSMIRSVPKEDIRKIDFDKTGISVVERLNLLLTVMYDTNEQLRQHRNVLEGALIAG